MSDTDKAASDLFYQGVKAYTDNKFGDSLKFMQQALVSGGPEFSKKQAAIESMQKIMRLIEAGKKYGLGPNSTPVTDPIMDRNKEFKRMMMQSDPQGNDNQAYSLSWKKRPMMP